MTIDEIIEHANKSATLIVDEKEFTVDGVEVVRLPSDEKITWIWATDGAWLILDKDADELMVFYPVEEEVEADGGFVTYRGTNFEQSISDQVTSEAEDEDESSVEIVQYDSEEDGDVVRSVERVGDGEESWFFGRMITEDDVRQP